MKTNKYVWPVAILIVLLAVYFVFSGGKRGSKIESPTPTPTVTPTSTPTPVPAQGTSVKKSGSASTSPKAYTDLVKEYENRRIQFDINCQAVPNNVTYINGTDVMFDNRSGEPRTITIGGVKHSLAGYGYKILTLSSPKLPKELLLSCGSAINVGKILLQ